MKKQFKISEIFESIQGESIYSGFPFLFVRFYGCPVKCSWCDTKYSWNSEKYMEYSLEELKEKIMEFCRKRVLFTGGEPLIQNNLVELMEKLIVEKRELHLETSGALDISQIPYEAHIIMDIKPPSANVDIPFLSSNLDYLKKSDEIKIVVNDIEDFHFLLKMEKKYDLSKRFLLSISPTTSFLDGVELPSLILESGLDLRINIQMHKHFWNNMK